MEQILKVLKNDKNNDLAVKLKEEGNKLFVTGKFRASLEKYNQALSLADQKNEKNIFSVLLGNRSAALFNLKEYKLCLEDIETALKSNYPGHLELKLLERRAKCFCLLGDKKFIREG